MERQWCTQAFIVIELTAYISQKKTNQRAKERKLHAIIVWALADTRELQKHRNSIHSFSECVFASLA